MRRVMSVIGTSVLIMALACGCGVRIPSDPDGSLDRIDAGVLRAGASPAGDLLVIRDGEVTGPLAETVEEFAQTRDADVRWVIGSEETLVDELEHGQLDLAVGGMTDATPWTDRVSVTRGYDGIPGADGRRVVVLLPLGENALQSALETFLDVEVGP